MASSDTMRAIVAAGCDLTILSSPGNDVMRELAAMASQSGSHLTVTADMSRDVTLELVEKYGKNISYIAGVNFLKE